MTVEEFFNNLIIDKSFEELPPYGTTYNIDGFGENTAVIYIDKYGQPNPDTIDTIDDVSTIMLIGENKNVLYKTYNGIGRDDGIEEINGFYSSDIYEASEEFEYIVNTYNNLNDEYNFKQRNNFVSIGNQNTIYLLQYNSFGVILDYGVNGKKITSVSGSLDVYNNKEAFFEVLKDGNHGIPIEEQWYDALKINDYYSYNDKYNYLHLEFLTMVSEQTYDATLYENYLNDRSIQSQSGWIVTIDDENTIIDIQPSE